MNLTHKRFAYWQLITSAILTMILAGLFSWYSNTNNDTFIYVSIVSYVLITGSLFYETFAYKNHKPSGRIAVSVVGLLLSLLMLFSSGEPTTEPNQIPAFTMMGFVFMLTVWGLFFMSIFSYFFLRKSLQKEGEADTSGHILTSALYEKRYLPVGIYQRKQHVLFVSLYILSALISGGLYYYLQYVVHLHFLVSLLILFFLLLIAFFAVMVIQIRTSMKPFIHFEKTLDYPSLLKTMDRLMAEPKLHPETRNFLVMLQANYASNYETEISDALWKQVSVPLTANYRLSYDVIYMNRLLWDFDFDQMKRYAETLLSVPIYRKQKFAQKQLTQILTTTRMLEHGASKSEMEAMWPIITPRKLLTVLNISTRALYYHLHPEAHLKEEYIQKLKEISPESVGLIQRIEKLS